MSEPYHLRCWTRFYASPEQILDAMSALDGRDGAVSLSSKLCADWEYEQRLERASDATRLLEIVNFTPRFGPERLVRRVILELFLRRHRRAARSLPTDHHATAVAILRACDLEP